MPAEPELRDLPLRELLVPQLETGHLRYFEPYERVLRENVQAVSASRASSVRAPRSD